MFGRVKDWHHWIDALCQKAGKVCAVVIANANNQPAHFRHAFVVFDPLVARHADGNPVALQIQPVTFSLGAVVNLGRALARYGASRMQVQKHLSPIKVAGVLAASLFAGTPQRFGSLLPCSKLGRVTFHQRTLL